MLQLLGNTITLLCRIHCDYSPTGCDLNCQTCDTNGANKCDSGECNSAYAYSSDTQTCVGTWKSSISSLLTLQKMWGRLVELGRVGSELMSDRQYFVYLFIYLYLAACASNCYSCNSNGGGLCDSSQCYAGYTLSDTQLCVGEYCGNRASLYQIYFRKYQKRRINPSEADGSNSPPPKKQ